MRVIVDVTVQEPALPSPARPLESVAPGRSITPLTITCPSQVVTAAPFDCTLTIVTPEPPPAAGAALRVTVPPGLFHLANSANVRFDADSRQLVLSLDRAPLATYTLSLSLMADEAGAGRTRTLSASVPIGERPSTASAAAGTSSANPTKSTNGTNGERRLRDAAHADASGAHADAPGVTQPHSGEMEPVEAVTPVEALEAPRESSATAWFALLPVAVLMLTLSALLGVWRD